jgi:hypothetical protein
MSLRGIIDLRRILHRNYMALYAAMHTWKLDLLPLLRYSQLRDAMMCYTQLRVADSRTKQPKCLKGSVD